jgi:ParB/RepB/Spo0J family partition protein
MPEEKANLSKQPAPEKKPDAAKLPNAPPKTEKPPDKNDGIKPTSAAESRKPEDKTSAVKPPPAEVKKADASGKDSRKDTVPTGGVKKPEASVKSPPAPAEAKKPDAPANTPGKVSGKDAAPVSSAEKPGAAAKPPEKPAAKVIPEDSPKKPDGKTDAAIPPASAEAKKPDAPANAPGKVSSKDTAPVSGAETPGMTAKPLEKPAEKVIPENGPKKPDGKTGATIPLTSVEAKKPDAPANIPGKIGGKDAAPVSSAEKPGAEIKPPAKAADEKKPTLNEPVPPAQKAEPSAKIMLGGKLHDPITPPKAADPPKEPSEQKGVRVTQIFEDRLDYPDEKALNSLPIPKEGEGFSMRLHPAYFYQFLDHPFSVNRDVKDYIELYESIRDNGINEPVKARPREKGGLELISGHRRHDIASRLNYPVPVIIAQVDGDTARVEVVDGNLHRMDIPTSELARAAKMKMEALARKAGRRSKMEQLTSPEPKKRTDQIVAEDMGISRNQVNRLVKINDLVPELKQQVDDKKLPFNTAVELAYLKPDEQTKVVDVMKKEQIVPSMAQATALKEASRHADTMQKNLPSLAPAHKVDENKITSIIKPKKAPELKVTFTGTELKDFFPGEMPSVAEVKRVVFDALKIREEAYKRQAKRQAAKDAIKSPEH